MFKNCLIFVLQLFSPFCVCQQLSFFITETTCNGNHYYLELDDTERVYIDAEFADGHWEDELPGKIRGRKISVFDEWYPHSHNCYLLKPKSTGKTVIKAITVIDGKKVKHREEFVIVDLPEPEIGVMVTDPESRFMWLTIVDEKTKVPIQLDDYSLCMLDFYLSDRLGTPKTSGVYGYKGKFFPSLTISEPGVFFEAGDQLEIGISLVHKKYGILISNGCTFTITNDHLWK